MRAEVDVRPVDGETRYMLAVSAVRQAAAQRSTSADRTLLVELASGLLESQIDVLRRSLDDSLYGDVEGRNALENDLAHIRPREQASVWQPSAEALGRSVVLAVRYALGRMTYVVSWTADLVRERVQSLPPEALQEIRSAIDAELERSDADGRPIGMQMDHDVWVRLARDLSNPA